MKRTVPLFAAVVALMLPLLSGCDSQQPAAPAPDQQAKQKEAQKGLMNAYEHDPTLKKP